MTLLYESLVLAQILGVDPFFTAEKPEFFYRVVGFSGSRNQLGLYFGAVAPLIMAYAPILMPILLAGLMISATASAWAGMGVGCLTLFFLRSNKQFTKVFAVLAIFTALFFYKFENISNLAYSERMMLYKHTVQSVENEKVVMRYVSGKKKGDKFEKEAFKVMTCNKWLGYGLGNFKIISPRTQHTFVLNGGQPSHTYGHAHNDLLEAYYELGRVGFGIGLLLIIHFIYSFVRARKTEVLTISFCCVLAQVIASMGIFTVHTAIGGTLLTIFYGIYLGELNEQNRQTRKAARLV
jgi:O-antigen ligase